MPRAVRQYCRALLFAVAVLPPAGHLLAQNTPVDRLAAGLRSIWPAVSDEQNRFELTGEIETEIDGKPQTVAVRVTRFGDESFDVGLTHDQYAVRIRRRADTTAFALPKHDVVFVGHGEVATADCLKPLGSAARLIGPDSMAQAYVRLLATTDPTTLSRVLPVLLDMQFDADTGRWRAGDVSFGFPSDGAVAIDIGATRVRLNVTYKVGRAASADDWHEMRVVDIERTELERQLARGVRRGLEIAAPSALLTSPPQTARKVDHGELRWIGGQRVVLLAGTPEQIGRAHGELLKDEAQRCIDSVLYTFGTIQTIRTGRWFRRDLDAAYKRLAPHIPERHTRELRAMAAALNVDPRLAASLNVFPELFHCSGFALFGKATRDGKLIHGRVLDYMTTIGLQDAATTFIVSPRLKTPFANVGYAGFIGSVSGMNAMGISLGEMGGRGEGQWDGVPMATLMRRALEECGSLEQVMDLWKKSPRTCEYYYVFADGKKNRAVGVAATPESIEFVEPGQAHPLLGAGIEDAVVLSAGSRLKTLRERVQQRFGEFDAKLGQWLMSRPVAMQSNLHNVLFVPEDGVLYVANADHKRPAAECPYVKLNLYDLLESMDEFRPVAAATETSP